MAQRDEQHPITEAPEMNEDLQSMILYALKEARHKLENGEVVIPFTALAAGDTLFMDSHPGEDVDECFNSARAHVQHATGALGYAFCYDGYVDTDAGMRDVLIAEGGVPGESSGYAFGYLYTTGAGGTVHVDDKVVYLGEAPNFMEFTGLEVSADDEAEAESEDAEMNETAETTEAVESDE